jgi:hypothetical protein
VATGRPGVLFPGVLFPEGTEVVAGGRAKRHPRNAPPPGNIPPRQGVAEDPTGHIALWHPCQGATYFWGASDSGGVAGARPPATTCDACGIRARHARPAPRKASSSQTRRILKAVFLKPCPCAPARAVMGWAFCPQTPFRAWPKLSLFRSDSSLFLRSVSPVSDGLRACCGPWHSAA